MQTLYSRLERTEGLQRERFYLQPTLENGVRPIPIDIIKTTHSPIKLSISLKPYDITHDSLTLRYFARDDRCPSVRVYGSPVAHNQDSPVHFVGDPSEWTMFTVVLPFRELGMHQLLDQPLDVQFDLPENSSSEIRVSDRLSSSPYSTEFHRQSPFNFRQFTYILQFVAIFVIGLLILLLPNVESLTLPLKLIIPAAPIFLFLFGDYIGGYRFRAIGTRLLFRALLKHQWVILAVFIVSGLTIGFYFDKIRCEWIAYRYQGKFEEFVHAANFGRDPVDKLAEMVDIAPERRENLLLFQYLLWRVRYDDRLARIVDGTPVGFRRPAIARALQERLDPEVSAALERGKKPQCGCVGTFSSDDPRLLWISSLEEQMGIIVNENINILKGIVGYIERAISKEGEKENVELGVLLRRYKVVYYSHFPTKPGTDANTEHEGALESLLDFVDTNTKIRASILEIAIDQVAESQFLGYCNIQVGVEQYLRVLDMRYFNRGVEILREFPPEKLSVFRIISVLQGVQDSYNKGFEDGLKQDCGTGSTTLGATFEEEVVKGSTNRLPSRTDWNRGSPSDPNFIETIRVELKKGWIRP